MRERLCDCVCVCVCVCVYVCVCVRGGVCVCVGVCVGAGGCVWVGVRGGGGGRWRVLCVVWVCRVGRGHRECAGGGVGGGAGVLTSSSNCYHLAVLFVGAV